MGGGKDSGIPSYWSILTVAVITKVGKECNPRKLGQACHAEFQTAVNRA